MQNLRLVSWLFLLSCTVILGRSQMVIESSLPGLYPDQWNLGPSVRARVISPLEVQRVTASYGTQQVNLTVGLDGWWVGTPFDISAAPSGPNTIQVTATDIFGGSAQTNLTFQIDRWPSIEMIEPLDGGLARPLVATHLVAEDDLAVPRILLSVNGLTAIDVSAPSVTGVLDLSPYEGQLVTLNYRVLEPSRPSVFYKEHQVLSLSNPRYQDILRVPGWIFDARGSEVLYTNKNGDLIKEQMSGEKSVLATNVRIGNRFEGSALITPTGAIYWEGHAQGDRVREIHDGTMIDHGPGSQIAVPLVKGNFAFIETDRRFWRDFTNDTSIEINPEHTPVVIGEEGTLVYAAVGINETNQLVQLRDGQISFVELDEPGWHDPIDTDGTNLVYLRATSIFESRSLFIRTPDQTIVLSTNYSTPIDLSSYPRPFALMNSGWTAFPRLTAQGHQQIWLRSPEGVITQATFYSKSSVLRALGANGDLVTSVLLSGAIESGTKVVYTPRGGMPKVLSNDFGARYYFVGSELYAYWGGTLFRVDTGNPAIGLTSPQYNSTSGTLSFFVTASEAPAGFTVQRTTNFVDWMEVGNGTVTNASPNRFEFSTSAGFFRVSKSN